MVDSEKPQTLEQIPTVLLVGGMGTRLQPVLPSTPKPLAPLGEMPFLELLLRQLRSQGLGHLVMCTGHGADQIEAVFGDGRKWDVAIQYSRERQPLGTAGALKLAEPFLLGSTEVLVMNGDSFLECDFRRLLHFHREHKALVSLAVRRVPDASRYGTVELDAQHRVIGFCEKKNTGAPGLVNGGVYLFKRAALRYLPEGPASLERDVFPSLLEYGVYAAEQNGMFIDIGTPEDYARAQALSETLSEKARPSSKMAVEETPERRR
jgi:NDP-sugar pyrophosphorylase family protein